MHWLRQRQVGCVFAQLLGRRRNRSHMRTIILAGDDPDSLARGIDVETIDAIATPAVEGLSIFLPAVLDSELLVRLLAALSALPRWRVPRQPPWGKTLVQIGLEYQIEGRRWAEVLGLGPFPSFLPPTRQGPITSFEIRTKPQRAQKSKTVRNSIAAHLAQMPSDHYLSSTKRANLFATMTPALKRRILGGGRRSARESPRYLRGPSRPVEDVQTAPRLAASSKGLARLRFVRPPRARLWNSAGSSAKFSKKSHWRSSNRLRSLCPATPPISAAARLTPSALFLWTSEIRDLTVSPSPSQMAATTISSSEGVPTQQL